MPSIMRSQHGASELALVAEMMSRTAGETELMQALFLGMISAINHEISAWCT